MTTRHGSHLAPTAKQLLAIETMTKELGYRIPNPTTRDEAKRIIMGYRVEIQKRGRR